MSNRHLSRTIAMQTLYEWDFNHRAQKLDNLIQQNTEQFGPGAEGVGFVENLVRGVTKNMPAIDKVIEKYATEWPVDKITIIDRNILRIGIYEMMFEPKSVESLGDGAQEVPPKVIINEAIEMAKTFGGESSGKFVNGVLGAVYNNIENKNLAISDENILKQEIKEYSVGGIVYKCTDSYGSNADKTEQGSISKNKYKFALIKDAVGKWTFAKGKIADFHEDEKTRQALSRELEEELGIKDINILGQVGEIDVVVHPLENEAYHKKIFYYLVETKDENLKAESSEAVKEVKWFKQDEVLDILGYENTKEVFKRALEKLKSNG